MILRQRLLSWQYWNTHCNLSVCVNTYFKVLHSSRIITFDYQIRMKDRLFWLERHNILEDRFFSADHITNFIVRFSVIKSITKLNFEFRCLCLKSNIVNCYLHSTYMKHLLRLRFSIITKTNTQSICNETWTYILVWI